MTHRNPLKPLTKKLKVEKNEEKLKEDRIDLEKPIIPGDIMDVMLEYSNIDKKEEPIGFFNSQGMASFNAFHTKLEAHRRPRITQLLDHIVKGRLAEAEAIIKENPEYLLESGDITDYSGRRFHRTALQSALAAKDVRFKDPLFTGMEVEECMSEMIIRHLKTLPDGEEAIAKQIEEQFPASWKENEAKENKKDLAAVKAVFQAIDKAKSPKEEAAAIQTFRKYLNEKYLEKDGKPITMTAGFDFNDQMLLKAYKLYDSYYDRFSYNWNGKQNKLVWSQVIGYLQRFLTACDGMAHAQGLHYLFECHESFHRSLNFSRFGSPDAFFFPLLVDAGLGFDSAVGMFSDLGRWKDNDNRWAAELFEKLCQAKTAECESLCSPSKTIERRAVAR